MHKRDNWVIASALILVAFLGFAVFSEDANQEYLNKRLIQASSLDTETVMNLISSGAELNTRDAMGMTPLMWAAYKGKRSTVVYLLERGADSHLKSNDGYTALMLADLMNRPTIVQLLRESEVSRNASQQ